MRLVIKDLDDVPDIFLKQDTIDNLNEILVTGNKGLISDRIYKGIYIDSNGKTQSKVREKLNVYYNKKCAYCETLCKAEIEHYRPKKGVLEDKNHTGYYWLCYEWSNLVPSCRYCNTEGGKGNKFPILGIRNHIPPLQGNPDYKNYFKANEQVLLSERPLLLHPELDEPTEHFTFKFGVEKVGVEILEKDSSERGKETIVICNLNRDYLQVSRLQNVVRNVVGVVNNMFRLLLNGQIPDEKLEKALHISFSSVLEESINMELEHTLLRFLIITDFSIFNNLIVECLDESQKEITRKAFLNFLLK